MIKIDGNKTYITVGVGIVTVVGAYFTGEMALADAVVRVLELLGVAAVRHGVKKGTGA